MGGTAIVGSPVITKDDSGNIVSWVSTESFTLENGVYQDTGVKLDYTSGTTITIEGTCSTAGTASLLTFINSEGLGFSITLVDKTSLGIYKISGGTETFYSNKWYPARNIVQDDGSFKITLRFYKSGHLDIQPYYKSSGAWVKGGSLGSTIFSGEVSTDGTFYIGRSTPITDSPKENMTITSFSVVYSSYAS